MRILAAISLGGAGHLNPLVPLLEAAERGGHGTLVIAPPAMEEMVRGTGFAFRPGGEPPEDEVAPIRERLPVVPKEEASVLGNRELFGRLAKEAMLPSMRQTCEEWMPDLILREPCEYSSALVAGERGIRTAQVAISLAEGEDHAITAAAPALGGVVSELRTSPYLTRFPASLDPSPFPNTVRFHEEPAPKPLPDWWRGDDRPLLYLTLGTVLGYMTIAADTYRTVLQAVEGIDVRVLLTVGRHFDASTLGPLPDHVHIEPWVDQTDVFAKATAVVCHGGSGTAFGALAAGLPVVSVPVFADQFENARRIAGAGAGVKADTADSDGISEAIAAVLGEPTYRQNAERIAEEMAATPTVDETLRMLLSV